MRPEPRMIALAPLSGPRASASRRSARPSVLWPRSCPFCWTRQLTWWERRAASVATFEVLAHFAAVRRRQHDAAEVENAGGAEGRLEIFGGHLEGEEPPVELGGGERLFEHVLRGVARDGVAHEAANILLRVGRHRASRQVRMRRGWSGRSKRRDRCEEKPFSAEAGDFSTSRQFAAMLS